MRWGDSSLLSLKNLGVFSARVLGVGYRRDELAFADGV
jgi:hypothetical protein